MKKRTHLLTDDGLGTLAEEYHVASRNQAGFKHLVKEHLVHYSPEVEKLVAEAPLHLTEEPRIPLPSPRARVEMPLEDAITRRTSGHDFGSSPLTGEQLATLLDLGNSVRRIDRRDGHVHYQRNAPNSGNLGSVEVYPIVLNVEGIEPGIYHYDSVAHDLARLRKGDFATWLRERVFFQVEFSRASVALVLAVSLGRLTSKYGLRAYRLALLDTGHVSQNLYLVSSAMGLQVCATAGFIDDELDAAIGVDGLESASMLVLLVGTHRREDQAGNLMTAKPQ
jgi:SagB-type dehydrogenase family enzyme